MSLIHLRKDKDRAEQPWFMQLIRREGKQETPALFTYHLREKLALPGCPLCRLVRESEEQWLWTLLYELTGDPEIHDRFASSLGLCAEHAELMQKIVEKRQLVTPSGVARLYETVTQEAITALSKPIQRLHHERCPLCRYREQLEDRQAYFLAVTLKDKTWQDAFTHSDGLCQPHLEAVLNHADRSVAAFIVKDHSRRLRNLHHRLQELQRKQRYDVAEPVTPEEAASWCEAGWRFGGMYFEDLLVHD